VCCNIVPELLNSNIQINNLPLLLALSSTHTYFTRCCCRCCCTCGCFWHYKPRIGLSRRSGLGSGVWGLSILYASCALLCSLLLCCAVLCLFVAAVKPTKLLSSVAQIRLCTHTYTHKGKCTNTRSKRLPWEIKRHLMQLNTPERAY